MTPPSRGDIGNSHDQGPALSPPNGDWNAKRYKAEGTMNQKTL
jgi:hypothetical protein